jgi:hypothetical protein
MRRLQATDKHNNMLRADAAAKHLLNQVGFSICGDLNSATLLSVVLATGLDLVEDSICSKVEVKQSGRSC